MPKTKQQVTLVTRLAEPDLVRFRELAISQKMTYAELLREAVLFYLDHYDQAKQSTIDSRYAEQLKASTNRICGLMAKTGIEVHAILEFLRHMEGGPELVQECMSIAAKRLDKGLERETEKIKEQMQKVVTVE